MSPPGARVFLRAFACGTSATINSQSEATQSVRRQQQRWCGESIDIPLRTPSSARRDRGGANTRTGQGDPEALVMSSFTLFMLIIMGRADSSQQRGVTPRGRQLFCQCMRVCDQHAQSRNALLDLSAHLGPFISHGGRMLGNWRAVSATRGAARGRTPWTTSRQLVPGNSSRAAKKITHAGRGANWQRNG